MICKLIFKLKFAGCFKEKNHENFYQNFGSSAIFEEENLF